ncbi:MAG: hypothetical protein J7501_17160 [Bdellovibrio sp.]|nr:hypothetical protein [Bdellovibrio sp.]
MKILKITFALSILLTVSFANAKDISVLFIGNSYVYLPGQGTPEDPALPKLIGKLVESIDSNLHLKYAFNTPGGYTYEKHLNDPKSQSLLQASYDNVILQRRA